MLTRARLQAQALKKGIKLVRRHYESIASVLLDFPKTEALINCTALGSLYLTDVRDMKLYPTRGQTILIEEPRVPIERMYLRTPKRVDPTVAYVVSTPCQPSSKLTPMAGRRVGKVIMLTKIVVPAPQRRRRDPRRQPSG